MRNASTKRNSHWCWTVATLLLLSRVVFAQTATGYVWAVPSGTPDDPLAVRVDNRGNVRTVSKGSFGNTGNMISLFFRTYDTNGVLLESVVASNNFATFVNGVLDSSGNVFVTGEFGHSGQFGNIQLTNPGPSTVVFVAKYSAAGVPLWAVSSSGGFGANANSIALDSAGNSYITGDFLGTTASPAKFGPSSLLNYRSPENDAFVAKVDGTGKFAWGVRFGDGNVRGGTSVAADSSGNCYAGGGYGATTGTEQFIAKFTTTGTQAWSRSSQTASGTQFSAVTAQAMGVDPQGNILIAGNLGGTNRIGDLTLSTPSYIDDSDLEVTRYDTAGSVQWAAQAGGTNFDGIFQMTLDPSGNAYLQGFYDRRTVIGGTVLTNSGSGYFLAKCTAQGAFAWGLPFVSSIARLGAAADGALYVTIPGSGLNPSWLYKIASVSAPVITVQPTNQTILANNSTTLVVGAAPGSIVSYQWFRGLSGDTNAPVAGAISNAFVTPGLSTPTSYWVRVSNPAGNADSVTATISFFTAPKIITPPQNTMLLSGQSTTLSVVATGTEPLSYQWYQILNGGAYSTISGATNSTYTTPALTNYANYSVIVQNVAGRAESQASVMVVAPVVINQQPQSMTISNGQSVTLSVSATGGQFINYQWFLGDSGNTNNPIPGAMLNTYTTPPLIASAHYWVLLTSVLSRVESQTAVLSLPDLHSSLGGASLSAGKLNLRFEGTPGTKWQVQSSTNLKTWGSAPGLGPMVIDASGGTNISVQADSGTSVFYRAILLP